MRNSVNNVRALLAVLGFGLMVALFVPVGLAAAVDSPVGDDSPVGEDSDPETRVTLRFRIDVTNDNGGTREPDDFRIRFNDGYGWQDIPDGETVHADPNDATIAIQTRGYTIERLQCTRTFDGLALNQETTFLRAPGTYAYTTFTMPAGADLTCTAMLNDRPVPFTIFVLDPANEPVEDFVLNVGEHSLTHGEWLALDQGAYAVSTASATYRVESVYCTPFYRWSPEGTRMDETIEVVINGHETACWVAVAPTTCRGAQVTYDMNLPLSPTNRPTSGPDVILGTDGPDVITGFGGHDLICGRGGADTILGGAGDDDIFGEGGRDVIYGHTGSDIINGGDDADRIYGGPGEDILEGGATNDVIYGGDASDTILGEAGNDYLYGQAGDDNLNGGEGRDRLVGAAGSDLMFGGEQRDIFLGGEGEDELWGGSGPDRMYGGPGADALFGEDGNDELIGQEGGDTLVGGADGDRLLGGPGNDLLEAAGDGTEDYGSAGPGEDVCYFGLVPDSLSGCELTIEPPA